MGGPQFYDAPGEAERAERARATLPSVPVSPTIAGEPLRSFEMENWQKKTDFSLWMTFTETARIQKLRDLIMLTYRVRDGVEPDELRLWRDLNYIIWAESHHLSGSRNVAALAFNHLFQKEEPEPESQPGTPPMPRRHYRRKSKPE